MKNKANIIALLTLTTLFTPATTASASEIKPTMTLTETVTVQAVPDAAKLNFEVYTEVEPTVNKPSASAIKALASLTSTIRKTLTSNEISTKDITSTNVNLFPQYQYINDYCKAPESQQAANPCVTTYQKITSYRASQSFTVIIRNTDNVGKIIDEITQVDTLTISPIQPLVTQKKKYINQARKEAVSNIKETANLYAQALSIKLGKITSLTESTNNFNPPYPIYLGRAEISDASTKVDLGTTDISVTVTITYALP